MHFIEKKMTRMQCTGHKSIINLRALVQILMPLRHERNQRESRMISVSDPSFQLASGTVCFCVHRHHAC